MGAYLALKFRIIIRYTGIIIRTWYMRLQLWSWSLWEPKLFRLLFNQTGILIRPSDRLPFLQPGCRQAAGIPQTPRISRNHDRAIADPTFAKKGELPLESYISHERVGHFRHLFSIVPICTYFFLILLSL